MQCKKAFGCMVMMLLMATQTIYFSDAVIIKGSHEMANVKTVGVKLTLEQKRRAEALTSVFENGSPTIQYGYAENLNDGRGITCGRAGFTTGTGDARIVVEMYTKVKPDNSLAVYLPELKRLEAEQNKTGQNQSDTSGLDAQGDFIEDWVVASKDNVFRNIQDEAVEQLYFSEATRIANQLDLKYPLSVAIMYDTIIQHGNGDLEDLDALRSLIDRTNRKFKKRTTVNVNESVWLNAFLDVRKASLMNPDREESKDEWSKSISRVDVFKVLVKTQNYDLNKPIKITVEDWEGTIIP